MIELHDRTTHTVIKYFNAICDQEIRKYLPQKVSTEAEGLADFG